LLAALAAVVLLPGCAQVTTPVGAKNDGSLTLQLGARPPLRVDADTLRAHAPEKLVVDWQREGNVEKATFTGVRLTSLLALLNVPLVATCVVTGCPQSLLQSWLMASRSASESPTSSRRSRADAPSSPGNVTGNYWHRARRHCAS
jgi:hypothetical protein